MRLCSPLSVSAAGGSSTNVQAPALVGGPPCLRDRPCCAQDANSLDVFVQGTDNALWYKHYQQGQAGRRGQSLGGVLTVSHPLPCPDLTGRSTSLSAAPTAPSGRGLPRTAAPPGPPGPRSAGSSSRHRPGRVRLGRHANRLVGHRHEQRPLAHVEGQRGHAQLAIPRRGPDLVTRCDLIGEWCDRRLCPRHRQRPLAAGVYQQRMVRLEVSRRAACLRHRTGRLLMGRRSSRRLCTRHRQRPVA